MDLKLSEKVEEFFSANFKVSEYTVVSFYAEKLSMWDFSMVFLRCHGKLDMWEKYGI